MSILLFKDDALTQPVKTPQKFTRASTLSPYQSFTLTKMNGTDMAHLYKYNGLTHTKLVQGTDFTLSGNIITTAASLGATDVLIAVPIDRLNLNFGGVFGATKTNTVSVIFKREAAYMYDNLLLASDDLDKEPFAQNLIDMPFTFVASQSGINSLGEAVVGSKCTSPQLTGLTINSLEGYALVLNNVYIGKILSNDTDSIIVNNATYSRTGEVGDDISIFSIGSLLFALDINGTVPSNGDFKPVINLPNLDLGKDTVKVWIRDTVIIPEVATNYPNMAFKLSGIEYLA